MRSIGPAVTREQSPAFLRNSNGRLDLPGPTQEAANKTLPKKSKKAKWLSGEALQIVEEQREVKTKGERGRYIQLNTEFQRTARREKKAFFNEQCLTIEEDNKRGKTRDRFRKIGNIKGAFHPKMGTIKDKNGRDLVDAEEIKM